MKKEFKDLTERIDDLIKQLQPLLPKLAAARHNYLTNRCTKNEETLNRIQTAVMALHQEIVRLTDELPKASGLPAEDFEKDMAEVSERNPGRDRMLRENLTSERVDATAYVEAVLPQALEHILSLLPKGWLENEAETATRIHALTQPDGFLSLTKGMRLESENCSVHRLRQAIRVSQDYLDGNPLYDHFAGALLIPAMAQLAIQGHNIKQVGGARDERLKHLWAGPSSEVNSTIFELLTAAACVEMGRAVDFLPTTHNKSPDLRCHDPFPLVIECKRQEPISKYEASEEAVMRRLFLALREAARKKGLSGTFHLTLSVEASKLDFDDVVAKLVSQRLAPDPANNLTYPWGVISLMPQPSFVGLPFGMRIYSPNMLEYLFRWSMDLPNWDGICCSVDAGGEPVVDVIRRPIALLWKNVSPNALHKRTWAPTNLFGEASLQVPAGEFGIIYVSYIEGGRQDVADMRVKAFNERIQKFEHSAKVRIPISVLCRLYPRPLKQGQPDLIESGVRYVSGLYGEPLLFEHFPTTVFTPPE
ncbi:hypothetical protein FM996_00565 [Methylosinus sporium]|uniref:Uncharacterized protein n=1 Tax=Methylosinus sporium TaxID=428 RepID=A0A549T917_METSR|nr:hypothetical protein [Methylosinus sporium]TRL38356.1 hypothetical protein FM996_00565 [Methylosinus sporium]